MATTDLNDPRIAKALGHPVRVAILRQLEDGVASPKEIAERLDLTVGAVAYHVRMLCDLELIELAKETRVRGAVAHHYRPRGRAIVTARSWEGLPAVARDALASGTLEQIADDLKAAYEDGLVGNGSRISRREVRLDQEGFEQISKILADAAAEVEKAEKAARKRLKGSSEGSMTASVSSLLFPTSIASDEG